MDTGKRIYKAEVAMSTVSNVMWIVFVVFFGLMFFGEEIVGFEIFRFMAPSLLIAALLAAFLVNKFLSGIKVFVEGHSLVIERARNKKTRIQINSEIVLRTWNKITRDSEGNKVQSFFLEIKGTDNLPTVLKLKNELDRNSLVGDISNIAEVKIFEDKNPDKKMTPSILREVIGIYRNQTKVGKINQKAKGEESHVIKVTQAGKEYVFKILRIAFAVVVIGVVIYYIYFIR